MPTKLLLRVQTALSLTERTFFRLPVFIGRKVAEGHCTIEDRSSSKLHASVDVRDGQVWVRDAGSKNGTFALGRRLEPDRWTAIGSIDRPVEFRIGGTTFQAQVFQEPERASIGANTLSGHLKGFEPVPATVRMAAQVGGLAPQRHSNTVVARLPSEPPNEGSGGRAASAGAVFDGLLPVCRDAFVAMAALPRVIGNAIEAAPFPDRTKICVELLRFFPQLADNVEIRDIFQRNGVVLPPIEQGSTKGAAALRAMTDLAIWYTGRQVELANSAEVSAFARRLQTTLDDFLLGYIPLLTGLSKFEDQMAIRGPDSAAAPLPSAAELAASLLDWRRDDARPRANLRASLAELMMHQVALLRGVMRGVKALLTELSPAVIEEALEREPPARGALGRMFSRPDPWTVYKRRHSDLADEENERFRLLFGSDFVSEYRQFTHEGHGEGGTDGE
jgi:type VI secretion system protein ImpI